jgi:hypothetical protein
VEQDDEAPVEREEGGMNKSSLSYGCTMLVVSFWFMFWAAIFYIAWHFIQKLW